MIDDNLFIFIDKNKTIQYIFNIIFPGNVNDELITSITSLFHVYSSYYGYGCAELLLKLRKITNVYDEIKSEIYTNPSSYNYQQLVADLFSIFTKKKQSK